MDGPRLQDELYNGNFWFHSTLRTWIYTSRISYTGEKNIEPDLINGNTEKQLALKSIATCNQIPSCSIDVPPRYSPSGVQAALSSSSTHCTLIDITRNMSQAVLDAIIHDVLQSIFSMESAITCY